MRLDDPAGALFVREVEPGKETVQLGRRRRLLARLGIALGADISPEVAPEFARLQSVGVKPLRPRHSAKSRKA